MVVHNKRRLYNRDGFGICYRGLESSLLLRYDSIVFHHCMRGTTVAYCRSIALTRTHLGENFSLPYGSKPNYSDYSKAMEKRGFSGGTKHRGASTSKKEAAKKFSHREYLNGQVFSFLFFFFLILKISFTRTCKRSHILGAESQ